MGCLEKLQKQTNKKINILEDTRELGVPSRRNSICKDLGLERKAKVQSRKERSENDPGDAGSPPTTWSPPTQSEDKLGRLFGGVYNWGCNTIPHVVLFTTLDCSLPILSTISSFLPSPSYVHSPSPSKILPSARNLASHFMKAWSPPVCWTAK